MTYVINNARLPRNRYLANAHAAGSATAIWPASTQAVCFTEFQNITKNPGESRRISAYPLRVRYFGRILIAALSSPIPNTAPYTSLSSPSPIRELPIITTHGNTVNRLTIPKTAHRNLFFPLIRHPPVL